MANKGINKVILIGNLGQDPEVRYMQNGGTVANITVATSEIWRDKQTGEQKEKTEWHRVVIFGKLAEVAAEYLQKGSQVYIEGSLKTRKWTDSSGVEKYSTEVIVNIGGIMQMLGSSNHGGSTSENRKNSVKNITDQSTHQLQGRNLFPIGKTNTIKDQENNKLIMDFNEDMKF